MDCGSLHWLRKYPADFQLFEVMKESVWVVDLITDVMIPLLEMIYARFFVQGFYKFNYLILIFQKNNSILLNIINDGVRYWVVSNLAI